MISSLAPPSDLIPPCELNSSTAMSAPCRSSCPCRAQGPESGAIIAILTDFACALAVPTRNAGIATAPSASPAATLRRVGEFCISDVLLFCGDRDAVTPLLAEIGFDDAGIAHDVLRPAASDQAAMIEHREVIDQLYHGMHRVLDDQDGNALGAQLPDDPEDASEIVMPEPGECLVEQHQAGMRHECARQFHQAQFPRRQPSGDLFGLIDESDPVERRQGHVAGDSIGRGADKGADDDIFEDAHARNRVHDMKGASDAETDHLVWT